jgi:hypothetical protein
VPVSFTDVGVRIPLSAPFYNGGVFYRQTGQ